MTQEALKLALEALEGVLDDAPKVLDASIAGGLYEVVQCRDAITAIKEALAQPDQEPEWYHGIDVYGCNRFYHKTEDRTSEFNTPLYTTPPQRKPLTHEQRFDLLTKFEPYKNKWEAPSILIDMVEAAHGIKEKNT